MKRIAIITGGTKGLGREISLAFARKGYFVFALYSNDDVAANELSAELKSGGGLGTCVRHDVTNRDPDLWRKVEIQEADQITLVHNACASFSPGPLHQLSWDDFETNHSVAVKGFWECLHPLLRNILKNRNGVVVNVLSAATESTPPKGFAAYVSAKHALRGLTLALAAEFSDRGLKVFTVSPGFMETSLTDQWDERLSGMIRSHSGRITVPKEAAAEVVRLAESAETPGKGENYPL